MRNEIAACVVKHVEHFLSVAVRRENGAVTEFVSAFALEKEPSRDHRGYGITGVCISGVAVSRYDSRRSFGESFAEFHIAYLPHIIAVHDIGVVRRGYGRHPNVQVTASHRSLQDAHQDVYRASVIDVIDSHAHHIYAGMMLRRRYDGHFFAPLRVCAYIISVAVGVVSVYLTEAEYVQQAVNVDESAVIFVSRIIIGCGNITVSISKYIAVSISFERIGLIEARVFLHPVRHEYFQNPLGYRQSDDLDVSVVIAFVSVYGKTNGINPRSGRSRKRIGGIVGVESLIFRDDRNVVYIDSVVAFEHVCRRYYRLFVSVVLVTQRIVIRFDVSESVIDVDGYFYDLRREILRGKRAFFKSITGERAERIAHFVHELIEESIVVSRYLIVGEFRHVDRRESYGDYIISDNVVHDVIGCTGHGRSYAVLAPYARGGLIEHSAENILGAVDDTAVGIFAVDIEFVEAVAVSELVVGVRSRNSGRSFLDGERREQFAVIVGAVRGIDLRVEEIISRVLEARIARGSGIVTDDSITRDL